MEHELLHNEPGFHLKLTNKTKKDKEKTDPGERKKWNFRKTSTSETTGKRSPSPTSGLINTSSEVRSKRTVSPSMIFENQISDHDNINENEHCLPSPPIPISSPPQNLQQIHTSSKSVSFDTPSNPKRLIQRPQSVSTSPPVIARPQSTRKPVEKIFRQSSAPAGSPIHHSKKIIQQQSPISTNESFTPLANNQPTDRSGDIPRLHVRSTSDIPPNNQWKSVQQSLFSQTPEKLHQDEILNRQRITSEKDTPGGETLDESSNIMWQPGNQQELGHGNWTDFSSISNEVFVPDDKAWGMADNAAIEPDENGQDSPREAPNLSNSSNSSESEDEQETEENVWKITEEQRSYYLNQFKFLQPAEKGVVTGQKARDFFLKSGLSTDVLSKIWNLADLDNDGALNFEEFCIAMHVVVAVRHGLEVPTMLPQFLIPEQIEKQAPSVVSPQKKESNNDQLSLPDPAQMWARFSPDPDNLNQAHSPEEDTKKVQSQVQPQPAAQAIQQHQHIERSMSDPTSADEAVSKDNQPTRKISVGIPRTRGAPKQTSLLDQPHWAILPPPSKFTKETEDTGKSVPIGTIIPDDTPDADIEAPVFLKVENVDKSSPRDSQSNSSSSDEGDQKERSKSLTNEHLDSASTSPSLSKGSSHDSVGVSQDSVDGARKSIAAPVPPPRKKTGHSRSSSLDLQKLFNNKGGSNSFQPNVNSAPDKSEKHKSLDEEFLQNNLTNGTDDKETSEGAHESQENFADFSKFDSATTVNHPESLSRHRRSASLDSTHAIWVEPSPPQQHSHDQVKHPVPSQTPASLPRPVPKKKPASPPLPVRQKKDTQQDSGSDGVTEKERKPNKEPIHFVVKPLTRLEQLHARIRDLKAKNTILSRVNNELQQEFKEMMEKRIKLESSVEQLKPLSNG